ncbi:hypothetical protein BKA70DRAFT_671060 [Coprinopsis sp. MPI-PUGE-AT-0042]|nr:hypothetical protein BKA70DRAFT_671060 [Coprinopsis sp. MPI-PUGE-AT-0042]
MSANNSSLVRLVIVDDDDRSIVYQGPWTVYEDDFEEYPEDGPVYKGSQHRLLNGTGSVTFRFNGIGNVGVSGTSNARNISGVFDPSHTCQLDGVDVRPVPPRQNDNPTNAWVLCIATTTSGGEHALTLSGVSNDSALYIDHFDYFPDPATSLEAPTVFIHYDDLSVEYLAGAWKNIVLAGMGTQQVGAKMKITFTGSSAQFIGSVPSDYPRGNSTAQYSLDGGPQIAFNVPGLPFAYFSLDEQPFFEVTGLGPGAHELIVTHEGPAAPLVFNSLRVEDGDILQSTSARYSGVKRPPVGVIAGGTVGGFSLVLAVMAFILLRRIKRRRDAKAAAAVDLSDPPLQPHSLLSAKYEVSPLILPDQPQGHTVNQLAMASLNHHSGSHSSGYPFDPSVYPPPPPPYNASTSVTD